MQIYLIIENKKFRLQYNNKANPILAVNLLFSKLPKEINTDDIKDYFLVNGDEIFRKDDNIDIEKYNNKEFVLIFPNNKFQKRKENLQTGSVDNSLKNKTNMAEMIKQLTKAKEILKPTRNMNLGHLNRENNIFHIINHYSQIGSIDPFSSNYNYQMETDLYDSEEENQIDSFMLDLENINNSELNNDSEESEDVFDESEDSFIELNLNRNVNNSSLDVDVSALDQLISMGFSEIDSILALRMAHNRIEIAIEVLMRLH